METKKEFNQTQAELLKANKLLMEELDKIRQEHAKELDVFKKELELYKSIVDEIPIPLFVKDKDARYCILNKAYAKFFDVDKNDYIGKIVLDSNYFSLELREKYQEDDIKVIESESETCAEENFTVNNRVIPVLNWSKGFVTPDSKTKGLVGIVVDLSEQKKLEQELTAKIEELEDAYELPQKLMEDIPLGICVFDNNYNLVSANKTLIDILRYENKEEFAESIINLKNTTQPDGRETLELIMDEVNNALETGSGYSEVVGVDKFGEKIPLEVNYRKANIKKQDVVINYIYDLRKTKRMINEIIEAKKAAEESVKVKNEFLRNISHEIRTPLNGILGISNLLKSTDLDASQREHFDKIIFSADNLNRVISDVLDVSELDAGNVELQRNIFTIREIAKKIGNTFAIEVKEKGIKFIINTGDSANIRIKGDMLRINQVIYNLIDNAVKFTDEGSVSFIVEKTKLTENDITYRFSVRDTGIGIATEDLDLIFNAFTQSDASLTRKHGGIGLGLIICKRLIEMMGSEILIDSTLGKGSNFYFDLTFELDTACDVNLDVEHSDKSQVALLLVEDNKINQLVVSGLLKKAGYHIEIVNNGQEALDALSKKKFDLVFMDIQMPIMDGLTATKIIREKLQFFDLPIIALSAHSLPSDIEKSIDSGMNAHITKPVSVETLKSCIEKYLCERCAGTNTDDK